MWRLFLWENSKWSGSLDTIILSLLSILNSGKALLKLSILCTSNQKP